MFKSIKRRTLIAVALSIASQFVIAQAYPTKYVQLVTAFPPGSGVDFAARIMAERLTKALGQPFVVVNKPGGGGTVASAAVASALPDGYTLLVNSAAHSLYPALYPELKFDAARDLTGVASIAEVELVLVSSPAKGWRSVNDLLAYAKARPGSLTYGSAGYGTTSQMSFERLANAAQITRLHVPFKGTPEAVNEVLGGRVDAVYAVLSSTLALIKSQQLVALSVAGRKRSASLPNVPTSLEAGIADSNYASWIGLLAPSATPQAIVDRLNKEVVAALNTADVSEKLLNVGEVPLPQSTAQFNSQISAEFLSNAKLVKTIGSKPQ